MNLLVLVVLFASNGEASDIKTRAEAVVTIDRNERSGSDAEAIRDSFRLIEDHELKPPRLKNYDTRTLEVLFDAVSIASDRNPRPELSRALDDIFEECLQRGFIGNMIDGLYSRYVHQREMHKVRVLCERFPSKTCYLPNIVEAPAGSKEGPAVYTVSENGKTLTYRAVDLAGPIIVSAVSPGCHFSNDIVKLIEADPILIGLFRDHAVNIESAPYSLDAEDLAQANRKGRFRYEILYRAAGWKGFELSSTPQFYFVKDGKIAHMINGVKPSEFKERLKEGLSKIGLQ